MRQDGCKLEGCQFSVWLTGPLHRDVGAGNVPGVYHASLHYLGAWGAERIIVVCHGPGTMYRMFVDWVRERETVYTVWLRSLCL